jgi:hypothetical protein
MERGNSSSNSPGVLAVVLALTLLVLIVCVGASVEVGRLASQRSRMQNACDMSSLAAALAAYTAADPETWQVAARYYSDNLTSGSAGLPVRLERTDTVQGTPDAPNAAVYSVGDTTLEIRHPFRDSYTDAQGWDPARLVAMEATRTVPDPLFGGATVNRSVARARSVALLEIGGQGNMAIFAYRNRGSEEQVLTWTGSGGTVDGWVHSNNSVGLSGPGHHCTKWVEYVGRRSVADGAGGIERGFRVSHVQAYPLGLSVADLGQPDHEIAGDFRVSGTNQRVPPGYYRVHGQVDISGRGHTVAGVTFVADGPIVVAVSDSLFSADRENILFWTLDATRPVSLDIAGSGGSFIGLALAPSGNIRYSGSQRNTLQGALIGDTVTLTGTDFVIYGRGQGWGSVHARLVR